MAMTDNAQNAPFGAISIYRITSALTGVVGGIQKWNTRRTMEARFSALSPRELEDIGLLAAAKDENRSGIFGSVVAWVQAKIDAAKTARQLSALSPQMLNDIGLTQADVEAIRNRASFL